MLGEESDLLSQWCVNSAGYQLLQNKPKGTAEQLTQPDVDWDPGDQQDQKEECWRAVITFRNGSSWGISEEMDDGLKDCLKNIQE